MTRANSMLVKILFLILSIAGKVYCQTVDMDCLKYYARVDSLSKDKLIDWTESPIEIVGGVDRLNQLVVYPRSGLENQIQGRVFVRFVIDETGQMHCLQLVSGIREDFNNEALRVVKLLQFKPAIRNGRPVTSSVFLPIVFKLEK